MRPKNSNCIISPIDIQKLRDLSIETMADRLGMTVKRWKCLCSFHDDTFPSLTFYPHNNTYRCFVCEAHGGVIDIVMNKLHKSFPDACRWMADESNVIISPRADAGWNGSSRISPSTNASWSIARTRTAPPPTESTSHTAGRKTACM